MIVEAMKGYRAADLPKDAVAGLVIAALSIPIAMGYAEVVGLPAIYGLWASIVAPLAFGLLTGTRRVVFGMDSAAAAMTASMLAAAGIVGQDTIVAAMPLLTLLTALFLLLLGWAGAGRLIRRMPLPVMHRVHFRHRDHGGHRPDPAASGHDGRHLRHHCVEGRRHCLVPAGRLVGLRGGVGPAASPACTS